MPLFRKKPVVVQAIQLTWENWGAICDFVKVEGFRGTCINPDGSLTEHPSDNTKIGALIPTLEGEMLATEGDYIIKGVKGEYYPCKPDIFEATYDAAGTAIQFKEPSSYLAEAKERYNPKDPNCECSTVPECVAHCALTSMFEDYRKSRGPLLPVESPPFNWDKYDAVHGR